MKYIELGMHAQMLYDVQEFRKATDNKVLSGQVDTGRIGVTLDHYYKAEAEIKRRMRDVLRRDVSAPILAWQKREKGIGENLLARLLGTIGDPRIAEPFEWRANTDKIKIDGKVPKLVLVRMPPYRRTVAQLWSYCGHGDPQRKKRKGMNQEDAFALGNPQAKMLVWNLADACLKAGVREKSTVAISHYGEVYLKRRSLTAERVHALACVRCGLSGKPAQPDSPWSKGHQLGDALRIVGKEILKDLWIAAGEE